MELPHDSVDMVILVDDGSTDDTVAVARELNLEALPARPQLRLRGEPEDLLHRGAACRRRDRGDGPPGLPVRSAPAARLIPDPAGEADVVLGSRLKSGSALSGGMPWWKYVSNRFLTGVENVSSGCELSEYHTGIAPTGARCWRRSISA